MTGALIILLVTIAIGVILWAWEKARGDKPLHHQTASHPSSQGKEQDSVLSTQGEEIKNGNVVCCGLHAICEKTGRINESPVYYDDEELDKYIGRDAEDYKDEEIEEFRDVMLTLLSEDVAGWTVSLERRRINLPTELRPELELLLTDC